MIASLRGSVHRLDPGEVMMDVQGVGYRVSVPLPAWDELSEGQAAMLWVSTYVREDRFELYGFPDRAGMTLFEEVLKLPGIGPKMGLEMLSVPRGFLREAVLLQKPAMLTSIKGIGKKTAEKLLLELRSLLERKPHVLGEQKGEARRPEFDQDAIDALTTLGYDSFTVLRALKELPPELKTTEARIEAALRSL